jgi:hypothetical protein
MVDVLDLLYLARTRGVGMQAAVEIWEAADGCASGAVRRGQGGHQPILDWLVGLDWTLLTTQSTVLKLVSNPIHWPWIGWTDR